MTDPSEPAALLGAWSRLLLASLAEAGVRQVVISPGSRSTPLVLAATRTPGLEIVNLLDERSAAFYALGQARVSGAPSLLVCTSGTAGAHYLPAVIEAAQSGLPMLILTADRPFSLQGCEAPQTIDQRDLYGRFVRAAVDLGMPDASPTGMRALRRAAAQAVHQCRWPDPGPVHLNFRAEKPLEPCPGPARDAAMARVDALLQEPLPRVAAPLPCPDPAGLARLQAALDRSRRPLIVAGPRGLCDEAARRALLGWASGLPMLVEATSQLRWGPDHGALRVGSFELLLRDPAFRARNRPDLVIGLGLPPTSAHWERWLAEAPEPTRFVLHPRGWPDPRSSAEILLCAPETLAGLRPPDVEPAWSAAWVEAEARAVAAVDQALAADPGGELSLARAAIRALPAGALCMIGNSLPLRDVDLAIPPGGPQLDVLSQRGANGIDGLISGAAGAASLGERPLLLLLGDVSFLHDLGGLNAASRARSPLVIVVLDNGGGQIFRALPVARTPGLRDEELAQFTTPHGADLRAAAAVFGIPHMDVENAPDLSAAVRAALGRAGATVIVARTEPGSFGAQVGEILERLQQV